uniref:Small ribosomal subunit protein uS3m n=1 Tax=Malassezia furfur TaxID=55194 RepID=A0A2I6QCE1_MALFU|nr:ribosomal protein S3 [Malassezia furfur]UBU96560.1 ribosomal protein S3 [Malassezia furfur]UBU96747.1 ribosomal protein S3 [Malassezia furfur]
MFSTKTLFKQTKLLTILQNNLIQNNHSFSKNNDYSNQQLMKVANHLIKTFFDNHYPNVLISNPVFDNGINKNTIHVFYYGVNNNNNKSKSSNPIINTNDILPLSDALALLFEKEINIKLTRVHYPYMNSMILAQYLLKNASTNTFLHFSESILTYPSLSPDTYGNINDENSFILPSYITGIRLELSGRLMTEQQIPRVTKKSSRISNPNVNSGSSLNDAGVSSESMNNVLVDYAKFTSKNELGSFTLKVWISSIQCEL